MKDKIILAECVRWASPIMNTKCALFELFIKMMGGAHLTIKTKT